MALLKFAKMVLSLMAMPKSFPQLLFPFQIFNSLFIYVFFSVNEFSASISGQWFLNIILVEINIILRNSGTYLALFRIAEMRLNAWVATLRHGQPIKPGVRTDPLFLAIWTARLAVQTDISDLAGLLAVPVIVSWFVWRDGLFTIQATGILVTTCDLPNIWIRFCILFCIKPLSTVLARRILRYRIARLIKGLPTIFGLSPLLNKRSSSTVFEIHAALGLDNAQSDVIGDEFAICNLRYAYLARKVVRRSWRFFTCCVYIALVSAFPRHSYAPLDVWDLETSIQIVPERTTWLRIPQDSTTLEAIDPQLLVELNAVAETSSCATEYTGWDACSECSTTWASLTARMPESRFAQNRQDYGRTK